MLNLDFLNVKTVFKYLIIIGLSLLLGAILKNFIAFVFAAIIIFFSVKRNIFKAIEFFFIWLFISNFFVGQGYITIEFISKYIAKPSFLLFIVFIFFIGKSSNQLYKSKFILYWLIFIILTLFSAISQGQSPFVLITISSCYMVFLIIQDKRIKKGQLFSILNLFVAVALIQTIVSFLQVSEVITPGTTMMDDGSGGKFEWIAGLDDAASGTFGAGASHITSWYVALMSLLMLLMWIVTKKILYLFLMVLVFLQFATVDSKIILGVTCLMLLSVVFQILKPNKQFKVSLGKSIIIILFLSLGSVGFYFLWNQYYKYYGEKTGFDRNSVNAVYTNEAEESFDLILNNIGDWGKVNGFKYVYEDFMKDNPIRFVWGYGIQGYTYSGKMGYIDSKDKPIMKTNNLLNSRSGLIKQFAVSGVIGFVFLIGSFFYWYKYNNRVLKVYNIHGSTLLKNYLIFSFLAAFLYSIDITSIPLITFFAIISIFNNISNRHRLMYLKKTKNLIVKIPDK